MSYYKSIKQFQSGAEPALSVATRSANSQPASRKHFVAAFLIVISLCLPSYAWANRRFTASPTSVSFGTVALNSPSSQTVTLTSTGTGSITIKSISVTGQGFSELQGSLPVTLQPGQTLAVTVQFDPTTSGAVSGSMTIQTNSYKEPSLTVSLSGTGSAGTPTLSLSSSNLNFGNDQVGTAATQPLTLTSSGTAAVTINSASITGTGFSDSGATFPVTLNPGVAITLQVQFDPAAAGTASGSLVFSSNSSTGTSSVVSLSGTGTLAHQVSLSWAAPATSASPVAGYDIYRADSGSTSFQLLNSSVDAQTAYTDQNVQSGSSYSYYVESVDGSGNTSVPSSQVTVTIP